MESFAKEQEQQMQGGSAHETAKIVRGVWGRSDGPPQALVELASITDFNLFISTSFDSLLVEAMKKARPGFIPHRRGAGAGEANVLEYLTLLASQ